MLDQSYTQWVAVADLNNDTYLDLTIANNEPSSVYILEGYGNGSFRHTFTLPTGEDSNPYCIALGDLNNDHRIDIVVANRDAKNILIFFGDKNENYSFMKSFSVNSNSDLVSIVLVDINDDAILDILTTDYDRENNSLAIFYGYGDGNFTLPKIYPTGISSYPKSIATNDFNGDNKIDVALSYLNYGSIGILLQLKSEPFASAVIFSTGNQSFPRSVTTAHFNNDLHLDLAVANSGTDTIGIFLGHGNGYFDDQLIHSTGSNSLPSALTIGDFNNDGHIDIVVVNTASNNLMIFFGDGNGSFPYTTNHSTGIRSEPSAIAVAYLDRDRYLDVVVANRGTNNVLVFLGQIGGSFFQARSYAMGYNARPQSVTIADMNNDDLLDIIVANYGKDYVEILLQTC